MRSYGRYYGLAKALDVVGDRWSLLIVRELLLRGPCRYTDLRHGLPGIATNLLADRLRELEQAGVVRREAASPPIATTVFHLTPRGTELRAAMFELGFWGTPLLVEASDDDEFRSHWLVPPLQVLLTDHAPDRAPIAIEVRTGQEPVLIETVDGTVRTRLGSAEDADAVLTGPPRLVLALLAGQLDLNEARSQGIQYQGDPEVLSRVQLRALHDAGRSG